MFISQAHSWRCNREPHLGVAVRDGLEQVGFGAAIFDVGAGGFKTAQPCLRVFECRAVANKLRLPRKLVDASPKSISNLRGGFVGRPTRSP